MSEHKLVGGTLKGTDQGIEARCECGWSSGHRFSSFAASAAFMDHQDDAETKRLAEIGRASLAAGFQPGKDR